MRRAPIRPTAAFAVALTLLAPHVAVAAGDKAESGSCNIAAGGIGSGGNTVTCNFGLTPEQLKQVTEAAVKGAAEPLTHQIVEISKTLGVTEDAAKTLLKVVGEDADIPEDRLAEALSKVAGDYKKLQEQVAALNPDNPAAKGLVEQAKPEIEAGHFARAHDLLRQATQAQIAAAREAYQLAKQAQDAGDAQMLGAASSTAADGDVAMTERRYTEAAELFGQAAGYVPSGHSGERGKYLWSQAHALYEQGDQPGDKDALRSSINVYGRMLAEFPRSDAPLQWAGSQNNLGNALRKLRKLGRAGERDGEPRGEGEPRGGGDVLLRGARGADARAGSARLGADAEQPRRRALEARRAGERDGELGGGGRRLSRGAGGVDSRAGSASMGDGAEQSRQCAHEARRAGERDGEPGGGGRRLSRGAGGPDARAGSARLGGDTEQSRHCAPGARRSAERDDAPPHRQAAIVDPRAHLRAFWYVAFGGATSLGEVAASRQRRCNYGVFLNLCRREDSDGGDSWRRRKLRSRSTW